MRRIYKPGDKEFDLQLFAGSGAGLNYVNKVLLRCAGGGRRERSTRLRSLRAVAVEAASTSDEPSRSEQQDGTTSSSPWRERRLLLNARPVRSVQNQSPNVDPASNLGRTAALPTTSWVEVALPQKPKRCRRGRTWLTDFKPDEVLSRALGGGSAPSRRP